MTTLITGSAIGNVTVAEGTYLEGAPLIYFQDARANPLHNPDSDGFYWGLSGTTTYPVYELGCVTAVSMTENLTTNDVLCDNIGVADTIQQRNYLEFQFTVQSFFPFDTLTHLVKGGTVVETAPTQKFGFGPINNNIRYMVYAPKVYDEQLGHYIVIHLNRAKFTNAFTMNMPFGSPWQLTGIVLRGYADANKPVAQRFGMMLRSDASVIV